MLSAGAPTKAVPVQALRDWMDRNSDGLFLSAISVAEIEGGIAGCRRTGASAKARRLEAWLDTLLHLYGERILPVDVTVARRTGVLADAARGAGHDPGFEDLAIAATAAVRGLAVLTRNLRHFAPLGVRAFDPFAALPDEVARAGR